MALSETDRHAWEQPGVFEVAPGVHRIPLPLPGDALKAVNVYAVADGERVVLIDGGWALAEAEQLLADGLRRIGYELGDVREYLCTHVHRDHYTQAVALRRKHGGEVALGEGERICLEAIRSYSSSPDVARLRRAGADTLAGLVVDWHRDFDPADWTDPDHWLSDGAELPLETRVLTVIATPGHTRGHVVFHDPEHRTLFAGDHVLPHITPSIGVEPVRPPSPLRDYLTSLELVRKMPDAQLLPAHGPDAVSVHERIDELLAHHDARLTATAATVDAGAGTAFECATALTWTRRQRRLPDMDTFNQVLATLETDAHLRVLVERGWLRCDTVDGVDHYARA